MNMRQMFLAGVLGAAVAGTTVSVAQGRPEDNVGRRHPNLENAQRLCTQAYQSLKQAQRANEYDLGGHAQKAEQLLDQANREISMAANTSNRDRH